MSGVEYTEAEKRIHRPTRQPLFPFEGELRLNQLRPPMAAQLPRGSGSQTSGERGVDWVLQFLAEGLARSMTLCGVTSPDDVTRDLVEWTPDDLRSDLPTS